MHVWCHLTAILIRRPWLLFVSLILLCVAITTTLIFTPASAAAGVNNTISFQGRLFDETGNVVPDGYYNMQFRVYQDGSGTVAGNPDGTLEWTESYVNNNANGGVRVRNGFFAVKLGSITPFGTNVDWNQDTLWLSMNIAGYEAACTTFGTAPCAADGEMLPMKQMTSTPYAMNAGALEGKKANDFIQNSTSVQSGANFNISGSGAASSLIANTITTQSLDVASPGTLSIGTANAGTIDIGTNNANHTISIGTGSGNQTIAIGAASGTGQTTIGAGSGGLTVNAQGGFILNVNGHQPMVADSNGMIDFKTSEGHSLRVNNSAGSTTLTITDTKQIITDAYSLLAIQGAAIFDKGITIAGDSGLTYTTPGGYNMSTAINIPNYTVGAYSSIMAFGLPSTSASTARGLMVADARTGNHQATIGILSPTENNIFGMSYNGTEEGYLSNTGNTVILQGNNLNILTARNSGGSATVSIGNSGASGYALDVTGDITASGQYRINGNSALSESALSFSGSGTSTITSASGQVLSLNSDTNVQVGDGSAIGAPTLFTLDGATSAPTTSLYGSMYYDTTLGKVQCYEQSGWGPCGSAPDNFITLSPEYANAVVNDSGTGTFSTGICSDTLNLNDGSSGQPTICATNETYNFYKWTSSAGTSQTRSIFVTYQLPSNFNNFVASSTSLKAFTDHPDSDVTYQIYRNSTGGLTDCGSAVIASFSTRTAWQTGTASGAADPANCDFEPGDSILIKIGLTAMSGGSAYVSNLNFTYSTN